MHQFAVEFILHTQVTLMKIYAHNFNVSRFFHERLSTRIFYWFFKNKNLLAIFFFFFFHASLRRNWVSVRARLYFDMDIKKFRAWNWKWQFLWHRCIRQNWSLRFTSKSRWRSWKNRRLNLNVKIVLKRLHNAHYLLTLFSLSGHRFRTHCISQIYQTRTV